jgi:hypothetical protein
VQTPLLDTLIAPAAASTEATSAASGSDRRRSERVATPMPAWVSGESHDRAARGRDVSVNDLSMHGIGFRDARTPFRIGACHWLVVNGGAMRMSTRIRIVSCRPSDLGGFDVGAVFF